MAKAIANCTCKTCGASFQKFSVKANTREASRWEAWAESKFDECDECAKKRIDAENAAQNEMYTDAARSNGWVELKGSERQIAWAETIRGKMISKLEDMIAKAEKFLVDHPDSPRAEFRKSRMEIIWKVRTYILGMDSASWFINHKDFNEMFFSDIAEKIRIGMIEVSEASDRAGDTEEESAEEQTILRPETEKHEGTVEIIVSEEAVDAAYKRDDDFSLIVKSLGYRWESVQRVWRKKITSMTGTAGERAAELGNRLLNAGFAVIIEDAHIRADTVEGRYEPETHRWIGHSEGNFHIWWGREEDYYRDAKRLPSARWNRDRGCVDITEANAATVEDFAHTNGFRFTENAKAALERIYGKTSVVSPAAAKLPEYDEHPTDEILQSSRDIIDDLKDE